MGDKVIRNCKVLMDSGAFSAWTKQTKIDIKEYGKFILNHLDVFDAFVNLDVIPGVPTKEVLYEEAEESCQKGWENYNYLLSIGVPKSRLIHVFHRGDGFKWLQKFVNEGVEYIGLAPNVDKNMKDKIKWLNTCMRYLTDSKGYPLQRWHAFGVVKPYVMAKYPWYSVDATTWLRNSYFGNILMPVYDYEKDKWDYLHPATPNIVHVTSKEMGNVRNISKETDSYKMILKYLDEKGFPMGVSSVDDNGNDIITQGGVSNNDSTGLEYRIKLNTLFYYEAVKNVPEYPWAFDVGQIPVEGFF